MIRYLRHANETVDYSWRACTLVKHRKRKAFTNDRDWSESSCERANRMRVFPIAGWNSGRPEAVARINKSFTAGTRMRLSVGDVKKQLQIRLSPRRSYYSPTPTCLPRVVLRNFHVNVSCTNRSIDALILVHPRVYPIELRINKNRMSNGRGIEGIVYSPETDRRSIYGTRCADPLLRPPSPLLAPLWFPN